jgi:hypothetical protein
MPLFDRKKLISEFFEKLPPADKAEWLRHRKACDQSFFLFVREMGYPKYGGDAHPKLHKIICDRWQDRSVTRQFAFMPRGWRKTTVLTVWGTIWEYLQDPEIAILLVSEKMDTAAKWVLQMERQILNNQRLRWLYPELLAVDEEWTRTQKWSSLYFELPRNEMRPEYTLECIGIRGAAQGGHYNLIALDDLVGEKSRESTLVLQDALAWFDNIEELLVQPDRSMPNASRIRGAGTHWGAGDYGEYIQEHYPEYLWYVTPCRHTEELVSPPQVTYLNNPDVGPGESNFPEAYSTQYYVDMAANPQKESEYWCQHMNYPSGKSGATKFDYDWLRFYTIEKRGEEEIVVCDDKQEFPLKHITKYGLIDPGGFSDTKMQKGSSRNVLLVAGQPDTSPRKFIFETSAGRFKEPKDFMDIFFSMHLRWKVRLWKIETIAAQKYIYKDILEEKRKRGINASIVPMPSDVGKDAKDARIISLIDPCSRGEYFIQRSMKDLIGEYKSYPSGLTKDIVDMWGVYNKEFARRRAPEDTRGKVVPDRPRVDTGTEDELDDRGITGYG